ncbi:MAG TPA: hydroxymethylbilane synthase [Vicinamibacterales bacterium]|nr:hydroxymethylbilane synthase [Vicinamibacterales bacterium]
MKRLRIGTRGSALALWQSRHVAALLARHLPGLDIELVEITSLGDRVTDVPLSHVEGTGFFTASIEQALIAGEVDVAVHSYKDLPVDFTPGLIVAAVPERGPVEDVLCARAGRTLATLPPGARIGTCSTRRSAQVRMMRTDLEFVSLRGNVPTRVARINDDLDAVVLAKAGLMRLDLAAAISQQFTIDEVLPAPAQGALAIQCRAGDRDLLLRLSVLDHAPTRRAVDAERAMLHELGGGCSVPVGAIAMSDSTGVMLMGGAFSVETLSAVRTRQSGTDPHEVGRQAAADLIANGAAAILQEFNKHVEPRPALTGEQS